MPLLKFSVGDILRSKLLESKWYSWQITEVKDPVPNANKDGLNYEVTFSLIDAGPDLNGKEVKRTFSGKAMGMMIPLAAAAEGKKMGDIKPEAFEFEWTGLLNKKIDGFCKIDVYQGNQNNKVEEYAPYKSIAGAGPGF